MRPEIPTGFMQGTVRICVELYPREREYRFPILSLSSPRIADGGWSKDGTVRGCHRTRIVTVTLVQQLQLQ